MSTRDEAMEQLRKVTEFMEKRDPEGFAKVRASVARRMEAARLAGAFGAPPGVVIQ